MHSSLSTTTSLTPDQLTQVIELADANTNTLGHFPIQAFEREARDKRIIAAINQHGVVVGYVLYRTTRHRAVVVHLCVCQQNRRSGIARRLIKELQLLTSPWPEIVCHCAKEFTESIHAWTHLGFVPMGEKKGRGKAQRTLIRLHLQNDQPNLFTDSRQAVADRTLMVALDMNVAIDIHDADPKDKPEVAALSAEWLEEEVSLWITDEAMSEAARQEKDEARKRRMALLRGMLNVPRQSEGEHTAAPGLERIINSRGTAQDRSDIRQIAQAIAGNCQVFLTRDARLLRHDDEIFRQYGLRIMDPTQFIVSLDEVVRESEYSPARLQGSAICARRPRSTEIDAVVSRFLCHAKGEKKHRLSTLLRNALVDPQKSLVLLVEDNHHRPITLMIVGADDAGLASITALRVISNQLADTLARQAFREAVSWAHSIGCDLLQLDEPMQTHPLADAASEIGFFRTQTHHWLKWSPRGLLSLADLTTQADVLSNAHTELTDQLHELQASLPRASDNRIDYASVERLIWPAIIKESTVPNYVVPIRPHFAAQLFDEEISNEWLFGGEASLLLNSENVYYRSANTGPVPEPGGRILWYVSREPGQRVGMVRACSQILSVETGPAKALFMKYKRLGVYRWDDVLSAAKGDPDGNIMAIRFGASMCLPNPIAWNVLNPMIARHRGTDQGPPLSTLVKIPTECFLEIAEHGLD